MDRNPAGLIELAFVLGAFYFFWKTQRGSSSQPKSDEGPKAERTAEPKVEAVVTPASSAPRAEPEAKAVVPNLPPAPKADAKPAPKAEAKPVQKPVFKAETKGGKKDAPRGPAGRK